jgi:hypothetical protein
MGYGREFLKYNEQLPISKHKILRFNFKLLSMTHMVKVGFEYNLEVVSRTFESIAQRWSLMNLVVKIKVREVWFFSGKLESIWEKAMENRKVVVEVSGVSKDSSKVQNKQ